MKRWTVLAGLLAALLVAGSSTPGRTQAETYPYQIVDLGTLPGTAYSLGFAVNNSGQVAGHTEITDPLYPIYHAFRWDGGALVDQGTLGGRWSRAYGINEAGYTVGEGAAKNGATRAFLHDGMRMTSLLGNTGGTARAINNLNQVVGQTGSRAFSWQGGSWGYLRGLTGPKGAGAAYGINDSGRIVGSSPASDGSGRAVYWTNGSIAALPDAGLGGQASGVNNAGDIVGFVQGPGGALPARWTQAGLELLPLPAEASAGAALDVSAAGVVVGRLDVDPAPNVIRNQPFVWSESGVRNANDLIDPAEGWSIIAVTAISEDGKITGYGGHNGVKRAFLMLPL